MPNLAQLYHIHIGMQDFMHSIQIMHLSILIPGGKGAGNGWGFDKKIKNWVKCPLVGHSKIIKCFKTDRPRG